MTVGTVPTLAALAEFIGIMPDAIVAVAQDGQIVLANDQAAALFAEPIDALIGRAIETLVPDHAQADHPRHRADFFANPQVRPMGAGLELAARGCDGREFPAEISLSMVESSVGLLVFAAVRDVTERRTAKQQIVELNEELRRVNQDLAERVTQMEATNAELEAFSYSVSHDLRAPLRAIGGFTAILTEEHEAELSEPARGYLNRIRRNAEHMGQLIDSMLMLSRIHRQLLRAERVDLAALAQAVWDDDLLSEHQGRAIELIVDADHGVEGDPRLLRHVLQNLLGNAIKYSRPRELARVEFTVEYSAAEAVCRVRDNGVGFNPQYADKLFQVFQRLHRPEDFEGMGIGLALAARIVHRHGGRIWAEGAVDEGATFSFSLPVSGQAPDENA